PGGLEPPTHGLTVPRISPELVELVEIFQHASLEEKRLVLELVRRIIPLVSPPTTGDILK
ncbi:MAG: hypothetical protein WCK15_18715, partial [Pirellula sp.]